MPDVGRVTKPLAHFQPVVQEPFQIVWTPDPLDCSRMVLVVPLPALYIKKCPLVLALILKGENEVQPSVQSSSYLVTRPLPPDFAFQIFVRPL